jgi:hypothetical protein
MAVILDTPAPQRADQKPAPRFFVPIVHVRIPMKYTDIQFMCPIYEVPLYEKRFEKAPQRKKDEKVEVRPLPIDFNAGDDSRCDPYRGVDSYEAEEERIRRNHGDATFAFVGGLEWLRREWKTHARTDNPWEEARRAHEAKQAAMVKAQAAVETAQLTQVAVAELVKAGQAPDIAALTAAKPVTAQVPVKAALEQADEPVRIDLDDEDQAELVSVATKSRKAKDPAAK